MSIDAQQLRSLIRDVLSSIGLYSRSALELLMLTSAVESNGGSYIKQRGGPALGIFQMEPATHDDIWDNYLKYNQELSTKLLSLRMGSGIPGLNQRPNLQYQIAMARVHYLRVNEKLPSYRDIPGMARYWKKYYNTKLGKGTTSDTREKYKRYAV